MMIYSRPHACRSYNHAANIDPFATLLASPRRGGSSFMGKLSLFLMPLFGAMSLLSENFPVNRGGACVPA